MEKSVRTRLVEAGIHLLGVEGARRASARAAEMLAEAPHGSMRHHFGSQEMFLRGMARQLFSRDGPLPDEHEDEVVARWLAGDAVEVRARFEAMLIATRDPVIAELVTAWRDRYVEHFIDAGHAAAEAASLVALLQGKALEALVVSPPPGSPPRGPLFEAVEEG